MRRVLHVTASNAGRGAERFALDLRDALAERGWPGDVVAVAPGSPPALDIHALGARWPSVRAISGVRVRARDVDVVIAHGSSSLPACAVAGVGLGVPFVYRNIGDPLVWARSAAARWRVGVALRRAAAVAALTGEARDVLVRRYRLAGDRVAVLPTGVDERRVPLLPPPANDQPVAAVIGSLTAEKDVALAVDAVALVPGMRLVVAGEGPLRAELERHAAAAAPGRVAFLGQVDVVSVLAGADVVLSTSRTEGLPAVLIEAAMAGRPVVATDVGGVRSIVVDGVTGVLAHREPSSVAAALQRALALDLRPEAAREAACGRFGLASVADGWARLLDDVAPREAARAR